ncbi:hypothetical protein GCM10010529_13440 [Nesterenkonia aethiopica]
MGMIMPERKDPNFWTPTRRLPGELLSELCAAGDVDVVVMAYAFRQVPRLGE